MRDGRERDGYWWCIMCGRGADVRGHGVCVRGGAAWARKGLVGPCPSQLFFSFIFFLGVTVRLRKTTYQYQAINQKLKNTKNSLRTYHTLLLKVEPQKLVKINFLEIAMHVACRETTHML